MRLIRAIACPALVLSTTCLAAHASAQTSGNVVVDRVDRKLDALQTFPYAISQAQCVGGDVFEFPVTLSNLAGARSFEVWVGEGSANCALLGARQNVSSGVAQCTRIFSTGAPEQFNDVEATAEEIAAAIGASDCVDPDANPAARPVAVYFLLVRNETVSTDIPSVDFTTFDDITVDFVGPTPPSNVKATASDKAVELEFDTPTNEQDRTGYTFYCDDGDDLEPLEDTTSSGGGAGAGGDATGAGGAGGANIVDFGGATSGSGSSSSGEGGGAGAGGGGGGTGGVAAGDASASATSTSTGETASTGTGTEGPCGFATPLVAGALPNPKWKTCGSVEGVGGEGTAKGLVNGRTYAIAIAGVDQLENPGAISEVVCATPFAVTDFYEDYVNRGGRAGGGICAVSIPGASDARAWIGAGAVLSAAAIALGRRRLRRGGRA